MNLRVPTLNHWSLCFYQLSRVHDIDQLKYIKPVSIVDIKAISSFCKDHYWNVSSRRADFCLNQKLWRNYIKIPWKCSTQMPIKIRFLFLSLPFLMPMHEYWTKGKKIEWFLFSLLYFQIFYSTIYYFIIRKTNTFK